MDKPTIIKPGEKGARDYLRLLKWIDSLGSHFFWGGDSLGQNHPQLTSTKRLNPNLLAFTKIDPKKPLVKKCCNIYWTFIWLLVSTHLEKIRSFPLVRVKIKICETTT